jgi:hypothetical protein
MKARLAILLAATIAASAAIAEEYDYTMVVEVTEHSYLRKAASTSSEVASELAAGARLATDPVTIETPDDPKCKEWWAAEYRMTGEITVHGFLCTRLTRIVR